MVATSRKQINLVHLYPAEMNIYGDNGNVIAIKKRLEWRGIEVKLIDVEVGDKLPEGSDIIISGGGQDLGQLKVADDLMAKSDQLHRMHKDNVVCLTVCGTYQLFGEYFKPQEGKTLKGIEIFKAYTIAKSERLIGNIVTMSEFGELVGYENHSGNTYLRDEQQSLAKVLKGAGNNDEDATEGAISNNFFGTYLHGPLLPKNPMFTDELIRRALVRKYGKSELKDLNDTIENEAAQVAKGRPR